VIIRPIIRPITISPTTVPPASDPFTAVGAVFNEFNDGLDDWLSYTWENETDSGLFTLTQNIRIQYEIAAPGGGGGTGNGSSNRGGGGGAGGYIQDEITLSAGTYLVRIGAFGSSGPENTIADGANGGNASIRLSNDWIITEAIGGGGGGGANNTGKAGGSGGGGGCTTGSRAGGAGTPRQGFGGGTASGNSDTSLRASAAGGGVNGAGANASPATRSVAVAGITSEFNDVAVLLCQGGDGIDATNRTNGNAGGFGCGGHGCNNTGTSSGSGGRIVVRFNPL
jgi:hypothetical protein